MDSAYKAELVALGLPFKEMDAEIKAQWLTELRSGERQQANGTLRAGGEVTGFSYCCLGVLCDIIDPTLWTLDGQHDGSSGTPSMGVRDAAKLRDYHGEIWITDALRGRFAFHQDLTGDHWFTNPDGVQAVQEGVFLTELNDSGEWSFERIADLIEYAL